MVNFIYGRIKKAYNDNDLTVGQQKYRDYFINTALWGFSKTAVDTKLAEHGYNDCIVTQ